MIDRIPMTANLSARPVGMSLAFLPENPKPAENLMGDEDALAAAMMAEAKGVSAKQPGLKDRVVAYALTVDGFDFDDLCAQFPRDTRDAIRHTVHGLRARGFITGTGPFQIDRERIRQSQARTIAPGTEKKHALLRFIADKGTCTAADCAGVYSRSSPNLALRTMTAEGLLARMPRKVPGRRSVNEYTITEAGRKEIGR